MTDEVRILVVGRSGNGKSESGNTILFEEGKLCYFVVSDHAASCSQYSDVVSVQVRNRKLTIVDTPGTVNTDIDEYDISKEIYDAVNRSDEGFDAILVTFSYNSDGLNEDERKSLLQLESVFSEKFFGHVIFLFTHGDIFDSAQEAKREAGIQPLSFEDEMLRDALSGRKKEAVGSVMKRAKNRMILFNNNVNGRKKNEMSMKLIGMIDELKKGDDYTRYSKLDLPSAPRKPTPPPPTRSYTPPPPPPAKNCSIS